MRALVTGAAGFVGGRVAQQLAQDGWEVSALVRRDPPAGRLAAGVRAVRHDGTAPGLVDLLGAERPDAVFHLASLFTVEHASAQVDALIESNVRLGAQVLEAAAVHGVRRVVCAGTAWQEGLPPAAEGGPRRSVNLYAATKSAFEAVAAWYADAHGIAVTCLRLFDTYGPDDPRRKLVALLAEAARTGAPVSLTPGENRLDLLHVDDAAAAFRHAEARQRQGLDRGLCVYAVGSGRALTLREIVAEVERAAGRPLDARFGARPYRPREVLDPWRGPALPGWAPRIALAEGLRACLPRG